MFYDGQIMLLYIVTIESVGAIGQCVCTQRTIDSRLRRHIDDDNNVHNIAMQCNEYTSGP